MSFKDFLSESTGDIIKDTIDTITKLLKRDRFHLKKISGNKLEVESKYDNEIYHVSVTPLEVELSEKDVVLHTYKLVSMTPEEIADDIHNQLENYGK